MVDHANKIEHGNFESDLLGKYTVSNLELNTLFVTFQKLTALLKFANEALKTSVYIREIFLVVEIGHFIEIMTPQH